MNDPVRDYFRNLVKKIAKYQGKEYFLSKRTANNRRIKQLIQCFPEAKFINITRDGRAVAYSLTKVKWWDDHKIWWKNQKTPPELRRQNYSDIELAAINWVEEIKCIEEGIKSIPENNIISLKYENFAENSEEYILKCLKHIGVEADSDWLNAVKKIKIYNNNHLWERHLSAKEKEIVMDIQSDKLKELEYI